MTPDPELDGEIEAARAAVPEARRPDRRWTVEVSGLRLAVWEWGDESDPPLVVMHGGFDFAGTLDLFAPMLADAGWRVVSWDQRGHGDSDHTELYSWIADLRDAAAVIDALGPGPFPCIGHSKGGNLLVHLAEAQPHRFTKLVNLDGLPSNQRFPDIAERDRNRLLGGEIAGWLDHRRKVAGAVRRPDTLDGLARRRAALNPRLSIEWLRYLVTVGARRDPDGWRWKIDPTLRLGGFGPRRAEWTFHHFVGLGMPVLAVLATEAETLGWGTPADDVRPWMPVHGRLEVLDGVGHFVHVEQPRAVADLVLDFLS